MQTIAAWFHALYETTGINLTIIYDAFDRARFINGFLVTIELSVICIFFSIVIGIVGAWLQGSQLVWTRRIVQAYIQLFRNTPPLVQMYFFYFGLSNLLPRLHAAGGDQPLLSGFAWACISLSFFAGAFNVEIFRSGIEAIPHSTLEAAEALGYTRLSAYRHIILPLAVRVCLPALNNNLVNLVKTTTLAYAIAVPELLYVSAQIWSDNVNVPEMMVVLLLVYFALVGLLVLGMHRLEFRLRLPGYSRT
ncbi:MAG: amino acid ABC transporter permease [Rhodospirillales bacterium]|nr:amino acid ABC transporter permease [Rhodospirillales bacterium]MDE2198651.1 amino acid ABC transporter permease [Rhodospirillales bacterium]MDE2573845.1 amino acid ABC transporter permease [Rhodospirillales bacterium]